MSCCKNKAEGCQKNKEQQVDYLVCTCMGVMHSDICQAIEQGADNFEKLSEGLGVGTGCSSCVAEVEAILKSQNKSNCCKR